MTTPAFPSAHPTSDPYLLYTLPVPVAKARSLARDAPDAILDDNPMRWVSLPIQFHKIWDAYKSHESHFWTAEDVDVSEIAKDLQVLPEPLREAFMELLANDSCAMFGVEDQENMEGVGCFKLDKCAASSALTNDVQIPEARAFFGFQSSYENILLELQSIALLACCGEDVDKYTALVDDAALSRVSILRAVFWHRHVWDENEIGHTEDPPTIHERLLCDGLLKWVQVLGHRILRSIIQQHYPSLVGTAIDLVLRHTIETAERHTTFSAMLHKSLSEPFDQSSTSALLQMFLAAELEFLETRVFKDYFTSNMSPYKDDIVRNETMTVKASFGFGGVTNNQVTTLSDGVKVVHPVIIVDGDVMVEYEDDHAQIQNELITGATRKEEGSPDYPAFTVQEDSDF